MHVRMSVAIVMGCLLALPVVANAQTPVGDVTLKIPLNLTKLSANVNRVAVRCKLMSDAFPASIAGGETVHEVNAASGALPVSGGQIVTTMTVVFSIGSLVNPSGQTVTYLCNLVGGSTSSPGMSDMTATNADPALRITPSPGGLRGTFTW